MTSQGKRSTQTCGVVADEIIAGNDGDFHDKVLPVAGSNSR
jgi:hypothetical protein